MPQSKSGTMSPLTSQGCSHPKTELPKRDDVLPWLKSQLSERRYQHSLGVEETACDIGLRFQLKASQMEALSIAALLHDCAKCMPLNDMLHYAHQYQIPIPETEKKCPQTLHAIIGAYKAAQHWGIQRQEVLDAIRWHTTARSHMGLVEKIIYIADKTEPYLRDPDFSKSVFAHITSNRMESLDDAMLTILDNTVRYLLEREQWIHPATFEARNHFVQRVGRVAAHPKTRTALTPHC